MTARSCPSCRYSGTPGFHWSEPEDPAVQPSRFRCPTAAAEDERERLETVVAEHARDEKDAATKAARRIVTDAAERFAVPFSANNLREEIKAAGLENQGGLMGAAFAWASRHGYIEWTGSMVKSNDPGTNEHPLHEWRRSEEMALRYGQRRPA